MVVYDIGANVGFYTLLSSRLVGEGGRVFAFEPLPRNVAFLNRHVELNSAGGGGGGGCAANVTVIDAAVSDREGTAVFVPDGGGAPDRAHIVGTGDKNVDVRAEVEAGKGEAGLTVRTVSVDGLVAGKVSVRGKAQPLPPPDMMKIDVEGAEAMVLKGAARTILARMPIIFLATHGPQVHAVCCDMLRGWGYELRAVGGGHLDEAEEVVAVKR
jgi:FkbM family methyltransferase